MKVWINSEIIEESKATVSLFDRSYLYGEGVFEALMCYQGRPIFFSQHYARLQNSCRAIFLKFPWSEKELEKICHAILLANQVKTAVLRLTFSYIGDSFGVDRPKNPKSDLTIFCRPLNISPEYFEKGVKVLPLDDLHNDDVPTASIKSTSYLIKMLARARASQAKAYESILKNRAGFWVEGSRTNLFIVIDNTVMTAPLSDGLLPGVTRDVVIQIIHEEKIPFREDHISDVLLKNAKEVFLTGSTSEVMPVNEMIGLNKWAIDPSGITLKLQKKYRVLAMAS